jgi:hypothetical protein
MHLGGHGSLGINPHTQIYSLRFHPIINNNSGTHQVGKTGLLSTNILRFKDGGEDTTKETLKLHTSTYDQICDGFSLILPHLSVAISTKAEIFFRRNNFVAISTIQVCVETSMKLSLHVSPPSISVDPMHRRNYDEISSQ